MGIVFYSHRVSYPNCLSAQVLPRELKDLAVSRLQEVGLKVDQWPAVKENPLLQKVTHQQIKDNINYLQAKDQYNLWPDFLEFNQRLDLSRNQNLFDAVPEFKPYV